MVNHPRRNKLAAYGGRIITIDERRVVQLVDPNDNAQRRFQYRRTLDDGGIERRVLRDNGEPFIDTGSPWEVMTIDEIGALMAIRGEYHPILGLFGLLQGGDGSGLVYISDDAVGVVMPMHSSDLAVADCAWAAA